MIKMNILKSQSVEGGLSMSENHEQDRERRVKFDLLIKILSACVVPLFLYLRSVEGELILAREKIVEISKHQVELSQENSELQKKVGEVHLIANEAIISLGFVREALSFVRQALPQAGGAPSHNQAPHPRRRIP